MDDKQIEKQGGRVVHPLRIGAIVATLCIILFSIGYVFQADFLSIALNGLSLSLIRM